MIQSHLELLTRYSTSVCISQNLKYSAYFLSSSLSSRQFQHISNIAVLFKATSMLEGTSWIFALIKLQISGTGTEGTFLQF